jgi:hypothetical protein
MRFSILCVLVAACVPPAVRNMRYEAVVTTSATTSPKPTGCTFDILRHRPTRAFEELAALENDYQYASSIEELREAIADEVCTAGGDAVIARPNSDGYYPGGVIIRYTSPS